MPEAIAIFAVTAFILIILAIAGIQASSRSPAEKIARLQQRLAWLEERQRQAGPQGWDIQMQENLAQQLAETRRQLAEITAGVATEQS